MATRSDDEDAPGARGLADYRATASAASPRYLESSVITPTRAFGIDGNTTLKATFWHSTIEETPQAGDPAFVSIALNRGGGRVWRNNEARPTDAGAIAMQPFEGAHWRFEGPVRFVHLYVPFSLVGMVSESLLDRQLAHADLKMVSASRHDRLCQVAQSVQRGLQASEPTNLLLDSWALILSDVLVRHFSSHGERDGRASFGKLPARGVARVVDYIEASIGQDLQLAVLADVAAMSVYHFARRFKETVGVSPRAYVLSRRICRARRMLEDSRSELTDIAAACGFASQAHFTTAFQRDTGVTPGRYRRIFAL